MARARPCSSRTRGRASFTFAAFAALVSILSLAEYRIVHAQVITNCPAPMRIYEVNLYHGIGLERPLVGSFQVCIQRINFDFQYGGPSNLDSDLGPGQFANADNFLGALGEQFRDAGPRVDELIERGDKPGKSDFLGSAFDLDTFTIAWMGRFWFNGGRYTFHYGSDDGIRVWIDGQPFIDEWGERGFSLRKKVKDLTPGEHAIAVAYYENRWRAAVYFDWLPYQ